MSGTAPQGLPKDIDVGSQVRQGAVIDLSVLEVTVKTPEDEEARKHRRQVEMKKLEHGHLVQVKVLTFVGATIGIVILFTMGVIGWSSDAEVRKTASGLLGAIVSAAIGFIGGLGSSKLEKSKD